MSAALGGEWSSAPAPSRQLRPLELEPFSEEWLTWYAECRHLSEIGMLNFNDARRGILPPDERRARERGASVHWKPAGQSQAAGER